MQLQRTGLRYKTLAAVTSRRGLLARGKAGRSQVHMRNGTQIRPRWGQPSLPPSTHRFPENSATLVALAHKGRGISKSSAASVSEWPGQVEHDD